MSRYYTENEVNDIAIRLRRLKFLHKSPNVYVRFDNCRKAEWSGSYTLERHDDIASWYVHYDYKRMRVLRDVGLDEAGNVVTSASYAFRLCKRYENFPYKKDCNFFFITKEQFERAYGSTDNKEEDSCTPSESKQEDVCVSAVNNNDDTCESCQKQDAVEEKKKIPFLLSVIRALVLFVLVCFVLYVVLFLGMLKFLIV